MIVIEDLLSPHGLREYGSKPEMDPLTEDDALWEAQVLDVRIDALRSMAGVLLELRTALQLRESNTGVLVAHGVRQVTWSASPRSTDRTAWTIFDSRPRAEGRLFTLTLLTAPDADLVVTASSAAFYTGDVPGLNETPPDYGEDDEATIRAGLAHWRSDFVPARAVFLDTAPPA